MTSHPKDFSLELIDVIKNSKHICHSLHLPVQSGSNNVLKRMNRKYTREHYLDIVKHIRESIPDVALTTDIIVGFPGKQKKTSSKPLIWLKPSALTMRFPLFIPNVLVQLRQRLKTKFLLKNKKNACSA